MLHLETLTNPNRLKITCPNAEALAELVDTANRKGSIQAWVDGLDYWGGPLGNGWSLVSPDDVGALTGDPYMISEDIERDDHGNMLRAGVVYYYPNYAIACPLEVIKRNGFVIFNGTEE